jgi:cytochrome c
LGAAAFIKHKIPFGTTYATPVLSDEDAYDVAGFIFFRSFEATTLAQPPRVIPSRHTRGRRIVLQSDEGAQASGDPDASMPAAFAA